MTVELLITDPQFHPDDGLKTIEFSGEKPGWLPLSP